MLRRFPKEEAVEKIVGEAFTPESGLVTANLKLRRRALEAHFGPLLEEMYAA